MYRKFHNLRVRFAELDLSQGEVARMANISPATLCTRMTGKQPFTLPEVTRLCKVLQIPPEQIARYFFEDVPSKKGA